MVQLAPLGLLQVEHLGLARECSRVIRKPIREPAPGIKNGPATTGRIEMDPIDNLMPEIAQKTHAPSDQEGGRGKRKSTGQPRSRFRGARGDFQGRLRGRDGRVINRRGLNFRSRKDGFFPRATRGRSEERRVGKECQSSCSTRWSTYH